MTERNYIGPDPVRWLERLMDVNESASFTANEKERIRTGLNVTRALLLSDREANK